MPGSSNGHSRTRTWAEVLIAAAMVLTIIVGIAQAFPRIDENRRRISDNAQDITSIQAANADMRDRLIRMEVVGNSTNLAVAELKQLAKEK